MAGCANGWRSEEWVHTGLLAPQHKSPAMGVQSLLYGEIQGVRPQPYIMGRGWEATSEIA